MLQKICILFICVFWLVGCQSQKDEKIIPIDKLYSDGMRLFNKGSYGSASDNFNKIYVYYQGTDLAIKAELLEAYSLYALKKYDDSLDVLHVFTEIHPTHPNISYAYYMIALNNYRKIFSINFDLDAIHDANIALQYVVDNYSNTEYARDARLKLSNVRTYQAENEMKIGRFYSTRRAHVAAIKRFIGVIENYGDTQYAPEALYHIIEGFISLGLKDDTTKYINMMNEHYSKTIWCSYMKNKLL